MHCFTFEDLHIWPMVGDEDTEPHTINVNVHLVCTDRGQRPIYSPPPGDPGYPPEWEVDSVELINPSMQPVSLTETQFIILFPDGQDIINNALEDAACNGEVP